MAEKISMVVNGIEYQGWKTVSIRRAIETVAGQFNLTVVNNVDGQDWNILTQSPCEIRIGDKPVLTGYVDEVHGIIDSNSRSISITGRDKTCDLVDCSAFFKNSSWSNLTIKQLAEIFAKPFGVSVKADSPVGDKFTSFSINKGDTAFQAVEKACRARSLLPTTDGFGNLVLTVSGSKRADDNLVLGINILMAEGTFNMENRFSLYHVFSESNSEPTLGWDVAIDSKGEFSDPDIKRYRPVMLQAESQSTSAECKTRAKWEAMVRKGASRVLRIKVAGWKQTSGALWEINRLTHVKIPQLNVDSDMLISEVDYQRGDEGTVTQMSLKPPESYNPGTKFKASSADKFKSTADKHGKAGAGPVLGW